MISNKTFHVLLTVIISLVLEALLTSQPQYSPLESQAYNYLTHSSIVSHYERSPANPTLPGGIVQAIQKIATNYCSPYSHPPNYSMPQRYGVIYPVNGPSPKRKDAQDHRDIYGFEPGQEINDDLNNYRESMKKCRYEAEILIREHRLKSSRAFRHLNREHLACTLMYLRILASQHDHLKTFTKRQFFESYAPHLRNYSFLKGHDIAGKNLSSKESDSLRFLAQAAHYLNITRPKSKGPYQYAIPLNSPLRL